MNDGWSKLTIQERGLKKNIDFHFLETNKNLEQLRIVIRMALHHLIHVSMF
jgi:hypothetical protein